MFQTGCPWQRGLQYDLGVDITRPCAAHQKDWFDRVVPGLDPDIIVLGHQADDDPARARHFIAPDGTKFGTNSPGFEETLIKVSADSLNALKRPGRRLVVIEPPPLARDFFDPTTCLSKGKDPKFCVYYANPQPTPLELSYREQAARQPDITSLDLDRVECPRAGRRATR